MADDDYLDLFARLRELGATRVFFYPDGKLQSVEFVAPFAAQDDGPADPGIPEFITPKAFTELMKGADGP